MFASFVGHQSHIMHPLRLISVTHLKVHTKEDTKVYVTNDFNIVNSS